MGAEKFTLYLPLRKVIFVHHVQIYLKTLSRPQLVYASKKSEAVEVVRPRLSEASKDRWRKWMRDIVLTSRPKLKHTVTVTPNGKIITIEGGDSDSDSDDSCLQ